MTRKIKRTIQQAENYKLVRITYIDSGYNCGCTYRHYIIVEKATNKKIAMFSTLKLARQELQNLENKLILEG